MIEDVEDNRDSTLKHAREEAAHIIATAEREKGSILEEIKQLKEERDKFLCVQKFEPRVKLDVGGDRFTTSLTTLCRYPPLTP